MQNIKLFCLPYAGGSASIFLKWRQYLYNFIHLNTVEFAGRGCKAGNSWYTSLEVAAEDILGELLSNMDNAPYALFGHSMGAVIICEMLNKIYKRDVRKPLHIFLSGRNPLHIKEKRIYHTLGDDEFKAEIYKLGGLPPEILRHRRLCDSFIPIIKADMRLVETYQYRGQGKKWDVDISVFNGSEDTQTENSRKWEWEQYTTGTCSFHSFKGGHFFINESMPEVIGTVNRTLLNKQAGLAAPSLQK